MAGGRPELEGQGARVRAVGVTSIVGAVAGSVLLLTTSSEVFRAVVPFLILLACVLLMLQPRLARLVQRGTSGSRTAHRSPTLQLSVLLAAVYGAYFGAGLSVLLLGVLGIFLAEQLRRINALKNFLSLLINAVALVAFGVFGPVAWEAVLVVAAASLAGGYLGARTARRIPSSLLRAAVVAYGVVVSVILLIDG